VDLILPYDYDTEDAVLGTIIMYPEAYDDVASYLTDKEVFYQSKSRKLWDKLSLMIKNRERIDLITVCGKITKDDSLIGLTKYYVSGCVEKCSVRASIKNYAHSLFDKYLMRKIIVQSEKIKEKAIDNDSAVYDLLTETHTIFGELIQFKPSQIQDIDEIISITIDSMKRKESLLITTGYKNLDYFSGGLTRGEITIVGGRPGHGKTTLLINMLANILEKGYRAVFFSRELPNSELLKKIICLESQELSEQ